MPERDYYFDEVADGFEPTQWTKGPWSDNHQHGSPATMLVGHLLQQKSKMSLARLTIDILRPLPIVRLEVKIERLRPGRMVEIWGAQLFASGKEVLRASGLFLKKESLALEQQPNHSNLSQPKPPTESESVPYLFESKGKNFDKSIELKMASGRFGSGQASVWIRMKVALLKDKPITPLERLLIVTDCGNGIASFLNIKDYSFINPDLSVYINRLPQGEWVNSDAKCFGNEQGLGMSDSTLFDEAGFIGRANQSILLRKMN